MTFQPTHVRDEAGNAFGVLTNPFFVIGIGAAGGAALGTLSNPVRIDPTGTTTQPTDVIDRAGRLIGTSPFVVQTDVFTGTGNGTLIDVSSRPLKHFSLFVTAAGGTPTSWDVRLDGALNGVDFTSILTHTGVVGLGLTLFTNANVTPVLWLRARVAALVLAPATSLTVGILGVQ